MFSPKTALVFLFSALMLSAAVTNLPEQITENQAYSDTLRIQKWSVISNGAEVTIAPGSVVLFESGGSVIIENGSLKVMGEQKNQCWFGTDSESKLWNGILIKDSLHTSTFRYTTFGQVRGEVFILAPGSHTIFNHYSHSPGMKGIYADGALVEMDSCVITEADDDGIKLNSGAVLKLKNSRISNCRRSGITAYDSCELLIDTSLIFGCGSSGIHLSRSRLTAEKCEISHNKTDGNGAGINADLSKIVLRNVLFSGDSSATHGGALWLYGSEVTAERCMFYSNFAKDGAAVYGYISGGTWNRCYFSRNAVPAAARHGCDFTMVKPIPVTITNSLFKDNSGGSAMYAWRDDSGAAVTGAFLTYLNCETAVFADSTASIRLENSYLAHCGSSPFIVKPTAKLIEVGNVISELSYMTPIENTPDFTIESGSPTLNAGKAGSVVPLSSDFDLAGNPRIADGIADVGAFEKGSISSMTENQSHHSAIRISRTAEGQLRIASMKPGTYTVVLFGVNGRILYRETVLIGETGTAELPAAVSAGIYAVTISGNGQRSTQKLIL